MTFLCLLILVPTLALLALTIWNTLCWPAVVLTAPSSQNASDGAVSILIPARDEQSNIAECIELALAQGPLVREVLVYDDHSTDATPSIVEQFALRDSRVRLLAAEPLRAGWCGKTFACAQLAAAATARWLLFLDADARLTIDVLSSVLKEAETRNVTLLSCWPALELAGFWERVLMPLLNFVVFTLYPAPLAFHRRDASLGLAHGSFILAHRETYLRTGGHALVRAELFEDTRLAQAWRACGERSHCLDGQAVLRVRMYSSFGEIWSGFQKNFFPAFRRTRSFWLFITLHLFFFLLPLALFPLAIRFQGAWLFALPAVCVLLMRFMLAVRFRQPYWSVLLHPLGESVLLALGISSWLRFRGGRGVEWKGRRYFAGAGPLTQKSHLETVSTGSGSDLVTR